MKALLYCTKSKPYLVKGNNGDVYPSCSCSSGILDRHLNGKIVAEIEIDKVEEIYNGWLLAYISMFYFTKTLSCEKLLEKTQLNLKDMQDYLEEDIGYALHLKNLKVFDKPKVLFEYDVKPRAFKTFDGYSITNITYSCTKGPQNMCNVYDSKGNHYILISIQPQHLCRILNGHKTIEVRRKVLNCLKEMCKDE